MASLFQITKGEEVELYRVLSQAGIDAEFARTLIKRPGLAKQMVEAVSDQLAPPTFATPEQIFARFVDNSKATIWPFGADEFEALHQRMPNKHHNMHGLRLLTLDVWFGDLPTTFEALACWVEYELKKYGVEFVRSPELRSDPEHLQLLDPSRYGDEPSVRWVELNLITRMSMDRGVRPSDVRDPKKSAGLQVMTALAVHANALVHNEAPPGAWLAGLKANVFDSSWNEVPVLDWRLGRKASLNSSAVDSKGAYSVPSYREL